MYWEIGFILELLIRFGMLLFGRRREHRWICPAVWASIRRVYALGGIVVLSGCAGGSRTHLTGV